MPLRSIVVRAVRLANMSGMVPVSRLPWLLITSDVSQVRLLRLGKVPDVKLRPQQNGAALAVMLKLC